MLELLRTDPRLLRALPGCRPLGVGGGRLAYKPNRSYQNLFNHHFFNIYCYSINEKKYTICISFNFCVFLNLLMIFNRSGKFSDLWEVHVDSFANIWMLLDNVSDLLHDLSVELTKFTDIKIFLWRKYINTDNY